MWMRCRKWMCYQKQSHRAPGAFEPVATLRGRPSKSRSDRTSVRAVNPAKAINVQTFFSCMGSPSAAPARHPGLSPNDAARRVFHQHPAKLGCSGGQWRQHS